MRCSIILGFLLLGCISEFAFALKLKGSNIEDKSGNVVKIKGFNWFGFNNGQTMVDGLWSNNPLSGDFATVVRRQKLLGFNGVRLPFSFKDLDKSPRSFVIQNCSPPSDQAVAESVTPPGSSTAGAAPDLPNPPSYSGNACNGYLPNTSTRDRFIWVAKFFAKNGFYVMVDNHLREDQTALEDVDGWSQKWADLVKDLSKDSDLKDNLIVDLLNEPDNYGIKWSRLGDMYLKAMDAIEAKSPGTIFAIEGTGQSGLQVNWGDGFATERIESLGLSDPRQFFNSLLSKPYRNRVILSPHVYPPSVTFNYNAVTGDALYDRLSTSFGSKMTQGYCDGSNCQKFPVAIGEFGSKFVEQTDLTSMKDLARYLNNRGSAKDGKHNPIHNWFYWSWNANSGDTGGIVDDSWVSIQWNKIDYLTSIGLEPWSSRNAEPSPPSPTPSSPVPSPSPPPSSPVPSPSPPPPSPVPNPSPPPPSPSQSPSPPVIDGDTECSVRIDIGNIWRDGSGYAGSFNVFIKNLSPENQIQTPWTLQLSGPSYSKVLQAWNWDVTLDNNILTGTGSLNWLTIRPNSEVNVGFLISGPTQSLRPTSAILNGVACSIV